MTRSGGEGTHVGMFGVGALIVLYCRSLSMLDHARRSKRYVCLQYTATAWNVDMSSLGTRTGFGIPVVLPHTSSAWTGPMSTRLSSHCLLCWRNDLNTWTETDGY